MDEKWSEESVEFESKCECGCNEKDKFLEERRIEDDWLVADDVRREFYKLGISIPREKNTEKMNSILNIMFRIIKFNLIIIPNQR